MASTIGQDLGRNTGLFSHIIRVRQRPRGGLDIAQLVCEVHARTQHAGALQGKVLALAALPRALVGVAPLIAVIGREVLQRSSAGGTGREDAVAYMVAAEECGWCQRSARGRVSDASAACRWVRVICVLTRPRCS